MTPDIEQIRARLEALKTGWTSIAQWQQMSLDFRRHIIEDETALLAAIDKLTRDQLTARNAKLEAVAEDDVRDMANFCIAQGASKPWQEIAHRLLAALDALDD